MSASMVSLKESRLSIKLLQKVCYKNKRLDFALPQMLHILQIVIFSLLLIFFMSCLKSKAFAMEEIQSKSNSTQITSDKMEFTQTERIVEFTGNVFVDRQDFDLWCEELVVHLKKSENSKAGSENSSQAIGLQGQDQIQRIKAKRNVQIKMDNRTAQSKEAEYDAEANLLTLSGNVILKEDKNRLSGELVKLYLDEDRTEILGDQEKRVKVLFYSSPEKGKEKND